MLSCNLREFLDLLSQAHVLGLGGLYGEFALALVVRPVRIRTWEEENETRDVAECAHHTAYPAKKSAMARTPETRKPIPATHHTRDRRNGKSQPVHIGRHTPLPV